MLYSHIIKLLLVMWHITPSFLFLNQEMIIPQGQIVTLCPSSCRGVESIHAAIGDNIGILIQWVSTFLSAIIIGLVREWRLALLLLAVIPFMVLAGYAVAKVSK